MRNEFIFFIRKFVLEEMVSYNVSRVFFLLREKQYLSNNFKATKNIFLKKVPTELQIFLIYVFDYPKI